MKEIVATADLHVGMFVVELDRPWLETPFLMQGFLIEDSQTLQQVKDLCRFVYVDWQRSVGMHHKAAKKQSVAIERKHSEVSTIRVRRDELPPAATRDFVDVLRWLRSGGTPPESSEERRPGSYFRSEVVPDRQRGKPGAQSPGDESQASEGVIKNMLSRWFGPGGQPAWRSKSAAGKAGRGDAGEEELEFDDGTAWEASEYVAVEDELVDAEPAYAEAQASVKQLVTDVHENLQPDMERVRNSVEDMMHSVVRNPDALLWLTRLKRTDQYAYDHALDSSVFLMIFARAMGLEAEEMTMLGVAGLMQDIGKVRLPPRLLRKAGTITKLERDIFRTHVDYSLAIMRESEENDPTLLSVIARHHERYDGTGYPEGMKGDAIGLYGQMAGIVDCYSAMTRDRPWGDALSPQEALEEINRMRATWFTESVVDAFIQCVGLYPVGTLVELNTDEVAVVIGQNRVRRLKPRLLMLLAPDKTPNQHPGTIDMLYDPLTPSGELYVIRRALPPGAYGIDPQEFYLQ
ncbi:HD-GYP domain-containing protein [Nitrogeniibacter aestuarii]|uniref:HD-GYP domain-containing protein n=1 Tax=Nitrogeniibacter aestuarii TaxID=2815343 RepID=UPI001D10DBD4|nr:HD-GYP domain-containing protein [Nitrogeniibacter aestuarii]